MATITNEQFLATVFILLFLSLIFIFIKLQLKDNSIVHYWKFMEKMIEHNLNLYHTIIMHEMTDYDTSTQVYITLKDSFCKHILNIMQGKIFRKTIKLYFGNDNNFRKYLEDRFDDRFYRKYLALNPKIVDKI